MSTLERFWAKVDKTGDCWVWTASTSPDGYGFFWDGTTNERGSKRIVRAHRFSFGLHHGPIPSGAHILHACDNPPCIRPDHLYAGDNARNMADKAARGRSHQVPYGETHVDTKLTSVQVAEIRTRYTGARGELTALGNEYGVTKGHVHRIVNGRARRRG